MDLTSLKSRCQAGLHFFVETQGKNSFPRLFQLLDVVCTLWSLAPFLHFQSQQHCISQIILLQSHFHLTTSIKVVCFHGSMWLDLDKPVCPFLWLRSLILVISETLFLGKIIYLQVPGIRTQTFGGRLFCQPDYHMSAHASLAPCGCHTSSSLFPSSSAQNLQWQKLLTEWQDA